MSDRTTRSPEDESLPGGENVGHQLANAAQSAGVPPAEDETLGEEVAHVVESAAELGLGAVIAPFTGGETVNIVGSVASMLEAGVDRLTHLGERESTPETDPPDPAVDGPE